MGGGAPARGVISDPLSLELSGLTLRRGSDHTLPAVGNPRTDVVAPELDPGPGWLFVTQTQTHGDHPNSPTADVANQVGLHL